jgi:endonuclease/exonuclease/phosphatase family metal-dependent hydrolase
LLRPQIAFASYFPRLMMIFCVSKRFVAGGGLLLLVITLPDAAQAVDLRIVTYNTQADVNPPTPAGVLPYLATVIEGIGEQKYTGDGILQLPDIIALQETTSNSSTVAPLTNDLNSYYGSTVFNYSSYQATTSDGVTTGGGPNALIYNQNTVNLIASVGVGTPASGTNGEFRQVVRYEFQPLADKGTSTGIFYVYDSHAKSGSAGTSDDGSTDGALRNGEAQIIRNDEATNLPASAAVLYVGDFNLDGSSEAAYKTLTAATSPGGVPQGQGVDPDNLTDNYSENWASSAYKGILTDSDTSLHYRDDLQLMTSNVYNDAANTLDYVSGSYHTFGNNGTTAYETTTNSASNTSLNDLVVGTNGVTASQVLAAMNGSIGSDHLPVVADYSIITMANGIWLGGTGNWSNAADWSNGTVPNSSTLEVKIDNGNSVASVVTVDQNFTAADVILDANDSLIIGSGHTLALSGPATTALSGTTSNTGTLVAATITNTGTFTSIGTITETGTFTNSGSASIGGTQNWTAGTSFMNTAGTAAFSTDTGSTSVAPLSINASGGTVSFSSTQHLAGLSLASGAAVTVTQQSNHVNRSLIVSGSLNFGGSSNAWQGKLDLTANDLDIQHGNLANLTNQIREGFNSGTWNGTAGITSTAAAANTGHLTALGIIQNSANGTPSGTPIYGSGTALGLFDGANPADSDVLVEYTYFGDANLDGQVDGSDYTLIDNGFNQKLTGWYNGDFNYDGKVDGSDYTLIDNAFNTQGGNLSSTALIAASTAQIAPTSAVPEPADLAITFGAAALALLNRRRRRSQS